MNVLHGFAKRGNKGKQFLTNYHLMVTLGGLRESPKELIIYSFGIVRKIIKEIAQVFESQGRLKSQEDIWNVTLCDIDAAMSDKSLPIQQIADYREGILKSLQPHIPGNYPTIFDTRGFIFRYQPPPHPKKDNEHLGFPVSPGTVKGKAKVLSSPHEKPLLPGEILVAHSTNPGWTPLFVNAAGVVLEVGGMLQHGALVAREYGIPCVAGVVGVHKIFKDGMDLEVNGTTGVVTVVSSQNI